MKADRRCSQFVTNNRFLNRMTLSAFVLFIFFIDDAKPWDSK